MQQSHTAGTRRVLALAAAAIVLALIAAFAWSGGPDVAGAAGTRSSSGASFQPIQQEQTPSQSDGQKDGGGRAGGRDCPEHDGSGSGGSGSGSGSSDSGTGSGATGSTGTEL